MSELILGLDVGSVAAGYCLMDGGRRIVSHGYTFHHGDVHGAVASLLSGLEFDAITGLAVTDSTPGPIPAHHRYDGELAYIAAAQLLHPGAAALLVVGGEKFSLASFAPDGSYLGSRTNTSCAAGTGSFLDQQALRLKFSGVEELCAVAARSHGDFPKIASRCAVFAKTDLIHAMQEGYSMEEISAGLCHGLAKNIVDTLLPVEARPAGRVLFCGGVSRNDSVIHHLGVLAGIDLEVPPLGHLYGAAGACCLLLEEAEPRRPATGGITAATLLAPAGQGERHYYYPPLTLTLSEYPDFSGRERYEDGSDAANPVEVDIYLEPGPAAGVEVWLGIDIGSTSTKAVLVDGPGQVLAGLYTRTAGRPLAAVQQIFACIERIAKRYGTTFVVLGCGTTGSGRKFIGRIIGADGEIDEITAHARAACELNPEVDTIIEIGGQDAKFTTLSGGRVVSSTMNTVCAAGTGSFIEEQAAKLGCAVGEYAERTAGVRAPMVSDRCTVFMERDMNHYRAEGFSVDEVLAAALHAVRENYLLKVATEKNIGRTIFFQGATARNRSLVAAFEQRLERPILVSRYCHLTGALGAALILRDDGVLATSFRGFDLCRREIALTSEVCGLCTNHCKISVADLGGEKAAYGFLCGRDYQTRSFVRIESDAHDLLGERRKIAGVPESTRAASLCIGLPFAVHMVEDMVLWRTFFDALSIATITSEGCRDAVKEGKKLVAAEFCAPVTAMQGHIRWLQERADYVFLPTYLEHRSKGVRRQFCYYTQFLASLGAGLEEKGRAPVLSPVIRYLYTSFHTRIQLYRMLAKIEPGRWSFLEVSQAWERAVECKESCRARLQAHMTEWSGRDGGIEVLLLGRPYTVLSPAMNSNIPGIFRKLGITCWYQDMLRPEPGETAELRPLLDHIHWEYAAKILEAAEAAARRPRLYPVFITSFKCTPDAFALDYFKKIMERHSKPYLILQLDEHDSSVGYETRIEAAVRAFTNHHHHGRRGLAPMPVRINPDLAESLDRSYVAFPNFDRITCSFITGTLRREGYNAHLLPETDQILRESLKQNSGECIPLNAIAQGYINWMRENRLAPKECVLWLNKSSIACNFALYPHHIKQILQAQGMGAAAVYPGQLSLADISLRAAKNCYISFMLGGLLRRVACSIRPYEVTRGETDRVLDRSVALLTEAFAGRRDRDEVLQEIVTRFDWIETERTARPKVAIFGDMYVRDNRVMNQDLVRFVEAHGGEVVITPYNEYAKMIAPSYFRKWFNEGKYVDMLTSKALLAAMQQLEKSYYRMFARFLGDIDYDYGDDPAEILARYGIVPENTGESMDNILKIHYIMKHHPEVALFIQTSPALCCPSLITEAMRGRIERATGVPVVSITYDGTGGDKNRCVLPYLKYARQPPRPEVSLLSSC